MISDQTEIIKKEESKEIKSNILSRLTSRIKEMTLKYKRVIEISHKPDYSEFISSAKITGVGILLIGSIGFVIFLLYFLVTK